MKEYSCPFDVLVNLISGKWKMIILWHLNKDGFKRFGELQKIAHDASSKVLSTQLRQLEKDGLIFRKVYPEIPPRVEYHITDLGRSLWPVLLSMQKWSIDFLKEKNIPVEEYILKEFEELNKL
ncbi:MAG: winged helix-turn-helix transcriptional regulator [Peptostreptococcaceae bacterium]